MPDAEFLFALSQMITAIGAAGAALISAWNVAVSRRNNASLSVMHDKVDTLHDCVDDMRTEIATARQDRAEAAQDRANDRRRATDAR